MLTTGVRKVFRSHGEFCSTQPWEVIVATLTFLVCILTVWGKHSDGAGQEVLNSTEASKNPDQGSQPPWTTMELVVMTFIRCLALLHCYYHLKKVVPVNYVTYSYVSYHCENKATIITIIIIRSTGSGHP